MPDEQDASLIETYRREGVIRCRGLFDERERLELRQNIVRYQADVVAGLPTGDVTFEPDGVTVRNLWRMERHDAFFRALGERPKLCDLVAPLLNGTPALMGVETFNKPALIGSAVPPHQDNAYFCQTPPDTLSVWVAIDPATVENGAVEYLLGSHRALLPHVASGVNGNSFGLAEPPPAGRFERMIGTVDAGDALIHHGQTIHESRPNRTPHARMSLIFVYRGAHTQTDETLLEQYRRAQSP
jgi:phytanoyl-CoA hydroxylase